MSHMSNGEDKSKVQGVAMCHNLIGWESKVLDKWIREIQNEPMGRTLPLDHVGPNQWR